MMKKKMLASVMALTTVLSAAAGVSLGVKQMRNRMRS